MALEVLWLNPRINGSNRMRPRRFVTPRLLVVMRDGPKAPLITANGGTHSDADEEIICNRGGEEVTLLQQWMEIHLSPVEDRDTARDRSPTWRQWLSLVLCHQSQSWVNSLDSGDCTHYAHGSVQQRERERQSDQVASGGGFIINGDSRWLWLMRCDLSPQESEYHSKEFIFSGHNGQHTTSRRSSGCSRRRPLLGVYQKTSNGEKDSS